MAAVFHSSSEVEPPSYGYTTARANAERMDSDQRSVYAQSVFTNASTLFAGMRRDGNGASSYFVQVKRKGTPMKGRGKGYKDWVLCYATLIRSGQDLDADILIHLVPSDAGHNPSCPPRVILWLSSSSISLSQIEREQKKPLQKLFTALQVGHCTLKCFSYVFPDSKNTHFVASANEEDWNFAGFGLGRSLTGDSQAKAFLGEVRKLLGWRSEDATPEGERENISPTDESAATPNESAAETN